MRRKLFALGLSAAMVLCLASCTGKSAGGSEPKDKLVGTWVCEHDFLAEMKEQAVSGSPELEEYFQLDEFVIPIQLTFSEDDVVTLSVIEDQMETQMDSFKDAVMDATLEYLQAQIDQQGNGTVDLDGLLGMMGTSREDLEASMEDAMDPIMDELYETSNEEGQYKATEDTIFTSDDVDTKPVESGGNAYTLDGDNLTIDFTEQGLGELTFTRAD